MKYTAEKPTAPGFYWWHNGLGDKETVLSVDSSLQCWIAGDATSRDLHYLGGEWAGPIPMPTES